MANYTVTVDFVIDADSEAEAEQGIEAATQNLLGADILSATVTDVNERRPL